MGSKTKPARPACVCTRKRGTKKEIADVAKQTPRKQSLQILEREEIKPIPEPLKDVSVNKKNIFGIYVKIVKSTRTIGMLPPGPASLSSLRDENILTTPGDMLPPFWWASAPEGGVEPGVVLGVVFIEVMGVWRSITNPMPRP